jgi:hypothetical protein
VIRPAISSCCALLIAGALIFGWVRSAAADDRQIICRTISDAAAANRLPVGFLARLLWTESGFRSAATSPAGAEGVAQFMPETAAERGLLDPRDPFQAIYHAASLLLDLYRQFGNLGLAAAAYNAGAPKIEKWLQGAATLPAETRLYVLAITGRAPEDWAALRNSLYAQTSFPLPGLDCLNAATPVARHGPGLPSLPRIYKAQLDSHLMAAITLFNAVSRDEVPPVQKMLWREHHRAADSLCALFRAKGAACQVFDP